MRCRVTPRLSLALGTLIHFYLLDLKGRNCIIAMVSSLGVRSILQLKNLRSLSMCSHNFNLKQLLPSVEADTTFVCLRQSLLI